MVTDCLSLRKQGVQLAVDFSLRLRESKPDLICLTAESQLNNP